MKTKNSTSTNAMNERPTGAIRSVFIAAKYITALLLPMACYGQTASVPQQTVTTSAPVVPAQVITITTPRNGGKVSFTIPAQTLKPLTAVVPQQTAPVSLSGFTGSWTCTLGPNSQVITNPDGTKTVTDLECTITAAK